MPVKGLLTTLMVALMLSQISYAKVVRKSANDAPQRPEPVNVQALSYYERNYDILVENSTNSQTPGYKERVLVSKYDGDKLTYEAKTRFAPGTVMETHGVLDLAIQTPGFFVVELPNGNMAYTRDGRMTLDPQGFLVTVAGGFKMLSQQGPIMLNANGGRITIDPNGQIFIDTVMLQKLWVVDFENYDGFIRLSGSFFTLPEETDMVQKPQPDPRILQGYVEGSNVEMVDTLIDLPGTSRKYDANAKALQILGKVRQSSAEIGRP